MIDYTKFLKSLENLKFQYVHYSHMNEDLPQWMQEAIRESVIKRFELCFDSLLKVLKRYLNDELGIVNLPSAPKPILRIAHENNLLPSSIEQWFHYLKARQNALHDYGIKKELTISDSIENFLDDILYLPIIDSKI